MAALGATDPWTGGSHTSPLKLGGAPGTCCWACAWVNEAMAQISASARVVLVSIIFVLVSKPVSASGEETAGTRRYSRTITVPRVSPFNSLCKQIGRGATAWTRAALDVTRIVCSSITAAYCRIISQPEKFLTGVATSIRAHIAKKNRRDHLAPRLRMHENLSPSAESMCGTVTSSVAQRNGHAELKRTIGSVELKQGITGHAAQSTPQ